MKWSLKELKTGFQRARAKRAEERAMRADRADSLNALKELEHANEYTVSSRDFENIAIPSGINLQEKNPVAHNLLEHVKHGGLTMSAAVKWLAEHYINEHRETTRIFISEFDRLDGEDGPLKETKKREARQEMEELDERVKAFYSEALGFLEQYAKAKAENAVNVRTQYNAFVSNEMTYGKSYLQEEKGRA